MSEFNQNAMQAAAQRYAANGGDAKAFEQGFRAGWAASLGQAPAGGASGGSSHTGAVTSFASDMEKGAAAALELFAGTGLIKEEAAGAASGGSHNPGTGSFAGDYDKGAAAMKKLLGK